jgi:hypothetical protein
MSNFRNNGAKPACPVSPPDSPSHDDETPATIPLDDVDDVDPIARIRAKRKRDEALKEVETKRLKVEVPKPGEPTVMVVINNYGHWEFTSKRFVCK